MIKNFDQIDSRTLAHYRADPAAFIEQTLISPYDGQPYQLNDAERAFIKFMFMLDDDGRMVHTLLLYSAIKKSRKTEFSALLTLTTLLLFGGRYAEAFIVANDQEQAINRCFTACRRIVETSPLLAREAVCLQDRINFPATQSTISAITSDYSSIAGGHPTISVFSELWAFTSERDRRLYDELIPVPTRKISCRLIETHAGFEGEGHLLQDLYARGMQLPLVGEDLRAGSGMLMFWSHSPICHWQDERWISTMRRDLPANQFLRMIENRFTSTEASFINMSKWDDCVDLNLGHTVSNPLLPIFVGIDASHKHDATAVVATTFDRKAQQVRLVFHRIFQPTPEQPLNFEHTIEQTVLDLSKRFLLRLCLFDPYQMQATAQRLTAADIRIEEYPQSPAKMTAASQNLYDLIEGGNLRVYPGAEMRLAVSQAIAKETPRGWQITKQKSSHKIDVVIALALSAYAAVQGATTSSYDRSWAGFQPNYDEQQGVDHNSQAYRDQLLAYCNSQINGRHGGGGGRWS
jgi:phage terminase large subunit-like protein